MNNGQVRTVVFDSRIAELTGETLERYAVGRGWFRYPHPYTPYWQHAEFVFDDGVPILLTIPPDNRDGDLAQRAYEMIRQLSQLEERSEKAVLDDIVATPGREVGTVTPHVAKKPLGKPKRPARPKSPK